MYGWIKGVIPFTSLAFDLILEEIVLHILKTLQNGTLAKEMVQVNIYKSVGCIKKGAVRRSRRPRANLMKKSTFQTSSLACPVVFSTAARSCFNCAPEMVDHHLFFLLFHNRLKETFWPLSLCILEIFESLKNLVALSFYSELINHSFKTDRHFCTKSFSSLLPFPEIFVFSCCNEETIWLKSSHFKIIDLSFSFFLGTTWRQLGNYCEFLCCTRAPFLTCKKGEKINDY